jgi:Uma2 family endonuclease
MSTALLPQSAPVWACPASALTAEKRLSKVHVPSNLADAWIRAGQVALDRIFVEPAPGTATVEDAVTSKDKLGIGCELVNGILVAKPMGHYESHIAALLSHLLYQYLDAHPIGVLYDAEAPYFLLPDNVRKPDVSLLTFARMPGGELPRDAACPIPPDLAVEVLSPSNTAAEMELKLKQYFAAGVRLVWYIDPELKTARVFTAVDQYEDIQPDGILRGGDFLPGFELALAKLFEKAGPRAEQ